MLVNQCPNCYLTLKNGEYVWSCDDEHPEVLAQMDVQDQLDQDEEDEEEW